MAYSETLSRCKVGRLKVTSKNTWKIFGKKELSNLRRVKAINLFHGGLFERDNLHKGYKRAKSQGNVLI